MAVLDAASAFGWYTQLNTLTMPGSVLQVTSIAVYLMRANKDSNW